MTWREDLRRISIAGKKLVGASFRGKPFLVELSERSGGRRVVVHEFPLRNDPFVEDLGRRARTFRVDGYVIGDDYLAQRDSLLAALEAVDRPGELVHPYYGKSLTAVCVNLSVRETRAEGGIAMFALEFAEAPAQTPVPTTVVDSVSAVATASDNAIAATKAELVERYSPTGLPSFALGSAATALQNASAALGAALAPAVGFTQELSAMTSQINLLTTTAASLVRQPETVLDEFREAIVLLGNTAADAPGAVLDALVDAYAADLGALVVGGTATREREATNQTAMFGGLRRIIAVEAARLAPLVPYVSIDDANAARDRISDMLEEQAAEAGDTAYPALVDLRSQVLTAVPGASVLRREITVTRRTAIPSLLLAYQLYGSVDQEADVLARNRVRHPGFVSGDLKVLGADV